MSRVLQMRVPHRDDRGTVHVYGDCVDGFHVSHESASGNSWGEQHGPYARGADAITVAYALNRDVYGGICNVAVSDSAVQDGCPDVGLPSVPGDF
jgi:hypothetical protein